VIHAYANHEKVKKIFDAEPGVTLEEGIARMSAWAQSVGARKSKCFIGIEVKINLPVNWRE
jgi:UDP-glucose 4-epimerase